MGNIKIIITQGAPLAYARIELSIIGKIIDRQCNDIKNQCENIELDRYAIMPNHIHGIIIIKCPVGNGHPSASSGQVARSVINNNNSSIIIGSYKSTITKQINSINDTIFKWQKSFHDHIIRRTEL